MTKRLLSLAIAICLATIGAWADDGVTTVDEQTLWTFGDYNGQTTGVYNFSGSGLFLHSSLTDTGYTDFTTDTKRVVHTEGIFTNTDVAWSATSVLVAGQGVSDSLLTLGDTDAASADGPATSVAFNHGVPGILYVVYGAATEDGGTFYIRHRKTDETAFSTVYEKEMEGCRYTGPLAVPGRRTSNYAYTMVESVVNLHNAGTVYMGGTEPYCIYAILFVPAVIENAKVTLIDDSRKDRKVFQVLFGMNQKLFYMRPGQDTEPRSQSFKNDFITNPLTITVNNNGPFTYWTQETINKVQHESEHATIIVNNIAKRPTATLSSVKDGYSEYEVVFTEGTALYYKIGDAEEQCVEEGSPAIIKVTKSGQLTAYCKNDYVQSDILTATVYAPTAAPSVENYLDFGEITANQGADVPVNLDMTHPLTVEGDTLYLPSELTAATFGGRYAFGELTRSSQIRVRTSKQLYFASGQDLKMGILDVQAGDVVYVEYTGSILIDDPTALTAISATTDETTEGLLLSGIPYVVERDGDLLFTLATQENTVSITKMYSGAPIVLKPTITDRGKNIVRITAGKSLTGEDVTTCYTTDGSEPSILNGTSGPYDSFDVELLSGGYVTISAISYTADGRCSAVASLEVYIEDRVHGESFTYDDLEGERNGARTMEVYNVRGQHVSDIGRGKLYIIDGKKVIIIR